MLVPEIILYNTLVAFKNLIYTDYTTAPTDKSKTLLNQLFTTDDYGNPLQFETYNWTNQAVGMFTRDERNNRELTINVGYNPERIKTPTIHILMPSDIAGVFTTIGKDEVDTYDTVNQIAYQTKSNTYRSVYNLLITSDNMSEVMLMYYFIRSMFLVFHEHLELNGLLNLSMTGQDIQLQEDIAPPNVFHRSLAIQFDYESLVTKAIVQAAITKINFVPDNACISANNKY